MNTKIIATLAFLIVLAVSETQSHRHSHSHGRNSCRKPKTFNQLTNSCQCPPSKTAASCIGWQDFDEDSCSCYCPYHRHHSGCASNKKWSYDNCHCDCIRKQPKEGCIFGRWSKSQCKCVLRSATCAFGTQLFNNDVTIDGIAAGENFDGNNVYAAYINASGLVIPGGLQGIESLFSGFYSSHNGTQYFGIRKNVTYLTQTSDCSCKFVPKNDSIPDNSYLVIFNSGWDTFGIGATNHHSPNVGVNATIIGKIAIGNKHLNYFSGFDSADYNTTDYTKLVCTSGVFTTTAAPTPAPTVAPTNPPPSNPGSYFNNLVTEAAALANRLNTAEAKIINMKADITKKIQDALLGPNLNASDIATLNKYLTILNSKNLVLSSGGSRKKRQTATTCQEAKDNVVKYAGILSRSSQFNNTISDLATEMYNVFQVEPQNLAQIFPDLPTIANDGKGAASELLAVQNLLKKKVNEMIAIKEVICQATTKAPTEAPTEAPNVPPASTPTNPPTDAPTEAPNVPPASTPTNPPTDAPTEAPTSNTSSCSSTKDLYDTNGSYISSYCWKSGGTQDASVNLCKGINMTLFTITSIAERGALFNRSIFQWGVGYGTVVWISGKNGPNYVNSNDGTTPLGNFSYPATPSTGCIALASTGSGYDIFTQNCSTSTSNLCKWTNPNPTPQ